MQKSNWSEKRVLIGFVCRNLIGDMLIVIRILYRNLMAQGSA